MKGPRGLILSRMHGCPLLQIFFFLSSQVAQASRSIAKGTLSARSASAWPPVGSSAELECRLLVKRFLDEA